MNSGISLPQPCPHWPWAQAFKVERRLAVHQSMAVRIRRRVAQSDRPAVIAPDLAVSAFAQLQLKPAGGQTKRRWARIGAGPLKATAGSGEQVGGLRRQGAYPPANGSSHCGSGLLQWSGGGTGVYSST